MTDEKNAREAEMAFTNSIQVLYDEMDAFWPVIENK